MAEQEKRVIVACMRMVAFVVAMCIGVVFHIVWQRWDLTGIAKENGHAREAKAEGMLEAWGLSVDLKDVERECDATDEEDEKFIVSLLKSFGFDCDDEFQWGYSERRYLVLKGYESLVFVDSDYVRGACYGTVNLSEECGKAAKDWISMINAELHTSCNANSYLNVSFRTDGSFIWCDCEIPIELLRSLPSPEVQRKVLVQMLRLPADQVKANKSVLDSFEEVK